jgi:hypothetical protein
MLNSLRTADPFETWHKNRSSLKVVLFILKKIKMAANIKNLKIVSNSKVKRFQWKWIFTGITTCCTILRPFRFAMAAKIAAKIKKSSDLSKIWFPSRLWCCELISIVWEPCYDPSDHIISCFLWVYSILMLVETLFITLVSCMLLKWTVKLFELQFQKCYEKIGNLHKTQRSIQ